MNKEPNAWDDYDWDNFDLETAPLDNPKGWGTDWGGDGSDLHRPVRAHVLAALVPNDAPYPEPVEALKHIGQPEHAGLRIFDEKPIPQEYVADLVRMARDRDLNIASGDTDEVWAPVHAVYKLQQLDISSVVEDLIPLFDVDQDWYDIELPNVFAQTGEPVFAPIRRYALDKTRWAYGRSHAFKALGKMAIEHKHLRTQTVNTLIEVLEDDENDDVVSACALAELMDLSAIEAADAIRYAFERDRIDEMVCGDWATVAAEMGIEVPDNDPLLERSTKRWDEKHKKLFPIDLFQSVQNERVDEEDRPSPGGLLAGLIDSYRSDPSAPPPTAGTPAGYPPPPQMGRGAKQPLEPPVAQSPTKKKDKGKAKNKRKQASAARKSNRGKQKKK